MSITIIGLSDDAAMERFYEEHKDPRLATVKKDDTVPDVGDVVVLNDNGLEQIYGTTRGLAHLKTLRMRIMHVDDESMTYPEPTFVVTVDNEDINQFLIDHTCFDIVKRWKDEHREPCPECGTGLETASGGGVRCPKPGCGYWFCY